jgi:hypothetical protein
MPTTVHGTQVPDSPFGNMEVCHTFVYRWLVASRQITGSPRDAQLVNNGDIARPIMWVPRGLPARVNGLVVVMPMMIIGFWDGPTLTHSMIAVTSTSWYGTNNTNTFGTATAGRVLIPNVNDSTTYAHVQGAQPAGWANEDDEQWRRADGSFVRVTCKPPTRRHYY